MKIFIAFLFIISPFLSENAFPCSCSSRPSVYQAYKEASAVFVGKVISSKDIDTKETEESENGEKEEYTSTERVFRFQVKETFKGIKGKEVDIDVGSISSSCYSGFAIGESYLIYAHGENEKVLYSGFCSRKENLEYAQDQIYFIRELLKGRLEPQIYGSVLRNDNFPNSTKGRITPLQGIKVIVEGDDKRFETITDKNGFFQLNKIPKGIYKVKPYASDIYRSYFPAEEEIIVLSSGKVIIGNGDLYVYPKLTNENEKEIERLADSVGSLSNSLFAEFTLGWNNEVKGRVFDAEGKTVKFVAVRLLSISNPFEEIESDYILDNLDDDKQYSCDGQTPGRYYLAAEIYAPFGTKDKVRIFYPQAETPEKAVSFNLKAKDKLNFDFILPAKYVLREVKGKVFWSDGQPADRAKISFYKSETFVEDTDSDEIENHGYDCAFTDEQGSFVLQGFENAEYWLHAENESNVMVDGKEKEIDVKAKPIKVKVGKTNETLKITLPKP